ncbi:hypothetical protein PRUPE_1G434600 [Prunus persica]|uniref:Uncharacterized protein n=1 Tax=Prunus persica TaxID=3760 RepID=A0A251RC53_PRUPE|nr:hypothetical protein PRUPE_1G434600 [Prunus persica]
MFEKYDYGNWLHQIAKKSKCCSDSRNTATDIENILDCTFGRLLMLQLVLMYGNMEIKAGTYSFTLAHEWFMYV